MLKKSYMLVGGLLIANSLVAACSSDKVLPKGERISVLSSVPTLKPDVANGSSVVKVPAVTDLSGWKQSDVNPQHLIPNVKVSTGFVKQWTAGFGEGNSKREFLLSKPLINGGKVYALDAEGLLSAFNLQTGESEWFVKLTPENENAEDTSLKGVGIALDNGVIYAVTGYGDVYAIQAKDGKPMWEKSLNFPLRIAPLVANNKIYVQSVDNKFFALDEKNGDILWKYDISLENTTLVGGSVPAYDADLDVVITGFSNGELQSFNATIGTPLWSDVLISNRQAYSSTFLNALKAAPVIENGIVYAIGNANVLTAIDIRSGNRLWEKEIGSMKTPLLVGNTLYVVSNDNDLLAIDKANGNILWTSAIALKDKDISIKEPVMMNSQLIVTLSNGEVLVYNPQDGMLVNKVDLGEEINSAPIAGNGYILFTTSNAELIAYK